MLGPKADRFLVCAVIAVFGVASLAAQQPATTGLYTAEQAEAGRAAYQANCAVCHRADLRGSNEAPPLVGGNFLNAWRNRTTSELVQHIQVTMPPNSPGSVGEQASVSIVAYILQANGGARKRSHRRHKC